MHHLALVTLVTANHIICSNLQLLIGLTRRGQGSQVTVGKPGEVMVMGDAEAELAREGAASSDV